jgi:hypothetical protein
MGFFELEIGYIIMAVFFLAITAFVTTRPFMPKVAFKRGMLSMLGIMAFFITLHYIVTTNRIADNAKAFHAGKTILCENKGSMQGSQTVIITKKAGWSLKDGIFSNKEFVRDFHSARCTEELK